MNEFSSKLSLYETLRILIPGALLVSNFGSAKDMLSIKTFLDSTNSLYQGVFFFLFVFISGLVIYSFDIPKRINFFQKDLPTKKIFKEHPTVEQIRISNSYFSFYDALSSELKKKTEVYSGFYHFLINISFSSILCVLIFVFQFKTLRDLIFLNGIIAVVSLITAMIIYFSRLRFAFQRHLSLYYDSNEYKKLLSK